MRSTKSLHAPLLDGGSAPVQRASEAQCTVALIKCIIGTGSLTLPAGISKLRDGGASQTEAICLALLLLLAIGALNSWGFLLIGSACEATQTSSYISAWRRTLGRRTAFTPALASLVITFTTSILCASTVADTGSFLLAAALGVHVSSVPRDAVLGVASLLVLLPLSLLPSLAPLGTASLLGVIGTAVTASAMVARMIDGSYRPGGAFATAAANLSHAAAPTLRNGTRALASHAAGHAAHAAALAAEQAAKHEAEPSWLASLPSVGAMVFFVSMLSNAYVAHYNAPGIYAECAMFERDERDDSDEVDEGAPSFLSELKPGAPAAELPGRARSNSHSALPSTPPRAAGPSSAEPPSRVLDRLRAPHVALTEARLQCDGGHFHWELGEVELTHGVATRQVPRLHPLSLLPGARGPRATGLSVLAPPPCSRRPLGAPHPARCTWSPGEVHL